MNANLETYKFFVDGIIRQSRPKDILEIGLGPQNTTSEHILENFPEINLTTIDIRVQESQRLISKYKNFKFGVGESSNLPKEMKYDLILVDGDHSYEGVLKDIQTCKDLLKKDGYIIFHDTNAPQIKQALLAGEEVGLDYFNLESSNIAIGNYI
jgi:SAM-dependent methyltransferase